MPKIQKGRVPVKRAAELLNLSVLSVECGIVANALPIGCAWKNEGSTCYTYHISPKLLADYLGLTVEEVMGQTKETSNATETSSDI